MVFFRICLSPSLLRVAGPATGFLLGYECVHGIRSNRQTVTL
ncbi:uncharacterized protein METZ01_LOCUS31863 [marine metagenome]|uniref:Uncharacterized protein n=1 Tax=marine metagenome TaxID=408172 RepID=A0A381QKP8_9ZZZZ